LAGDVPPLRVARPNTWDFNSFAVLLNGDREDAIDDWRRGTSQKLSGSFSLEWDGMRTGYIPFDASATQLKWALTSTISIGNISVQG